ncbi:MAG TPA: methylmalonyl Co-A mutase-associated GTPase MeaB [Polyangiaceae bacterium]|nr:methylmalonyl Co-A mutase-associated GTPase MeaB [Polyangiaceae bacterium]
MQPPSDSAHALPRRKELSRDEYVSGVRTGDRAVLGRAISLIESNAAAHQGLAQEVLTGLLPYTGKSQRVGISGVPGVGKSTFIEALGTKLTGAGHRVAVLAVDPTSERTKGSILGDKTRMVNLSQNPRAFIRPSPSGGSLGGVGRKTRETMLLCEAAGFDVVLVETVGVGQSETMVADMVDFYLVLMLAGAGDELQGIKRGILELADLVAVNKADSGNEKNAERARQEYESALSLMNARSDGWKVPVVKCSALSNQGLDELWAHVERHREALVTSGGLDALRKRQLLHWTWQMVEGELIDRLHAHPAVRALTPELEARVQSGSLTATLAARRILGAFGVGSK